MCKILNICRFFAWRLPFEICHSENYPCTAHAHTRAHLLAFPFTFFYRAILLSTISLFFTAVTFFLSLFLKRLSILTTTRFRDIQEIRNLRCVGRRLGVGVHKAKMKLSLHFEPSQHSYIYICIYKVLRLSGGGQGAYRVLSVCLMLRSGYLMKQ